ncbi:MAG: amidohydrolase [Planctomycetota bacterium]|jgi:amidohydrolase|nr:amidohydrolase [Planctomycetota bacterium]
MDDWHARRKEFCDLRHEFHAYPELSNQEYETARRICEKFAADGVSYRDGIAGTGIAAVVQGCDGPVVGLRADMDALAIREETGLPWASRIEGVMHACGHDFHMAAAIAAGLLLHGCRHELPGSVKLIFQPAEENGPIGGALPMIEAGVLTDPAMDAIFACHVAPDIPSGKVLIHDGATAAGVDNFIIDILGKGGHAAYPHKTIDPISIAAQVVMGFNAVVARTVAAYDNAVVSVGNFQAGTRRNVIPDAARLEGTVRTMSDSVRRELKARVENVCRHYSEAAGGACNIQWVESFQSTINNPDVAMLAREGVQMFLGPGSAESRTPPGMAAEDFGRFLRCVPGALMWVGVMLDSEMNLHSPVLSVADAGLDNCVSAMLGAVLAFLFKGK